MSDRVIDQDWWGNPAIVPCKQVTRDVFRVFVIALIVRLLFLVFLEHQNPFFAATLQGFDQHTYQARALEILAGNWYLQGHTNYYSLLMSYFVALIYFFAGENNFWAVHIAMAFVGCIGIALMFSLARTWLSRGASWFAVASAMLYTPWLFYESSLLQEGLVVTSYIVFLWGLRTALLNFPGATWRLLAAGFAIGIAFVGRGNALLVAFAFMGWLLLFGGRAAQTSVADVRAWGWAKTGILTLGLLSVLMAVALRNHAAVDDFTIGGENGVKLFYIGNGSGATGMYRYHDRFLEADEIARKTGDNDVFMAFFWEDLRADPGEVVWNFVRKTYHFLAVRDLPDNINFQLGREIISPLALSPLQPHWFIPLGLAGLLLTIATFQRRDPKQEWIMLWLFFVIFAASIILILPTGRYRIPVAIPLAIFGGYFVHWLRHQLLGKQWLAIGGAVSMAAVLVVLLWPHGSATPKAFWAEGEDPYIRLNDYTNMALVSVDVGDMDLAAELLDEGWSKYGEKYRAHPLLLHSEIDLAQQTQNLVRLTDVAEYVYALNKYTPQARLMLAQIDIWSGKYARAEEMIRHVRDNNPDHPGVDAMVTELSRHQTNAR